MILLGMLLAAGTAAAAAENFLALPATGQATLRVIDPTTLELTLITRKDSAAAMPAQWNFGPGGQPLPSPAQFAVSDGVSALAVSAAGFMRQPRYAPFYSRDNDLNRDLRLENKIFLRLAQPLTEGRTVRVTGPASVTSGLDFTAVFDAGRWSPALHVNQVGYGPSLPKKAIVGYFLGTLGALPLAGGSAFQVVDAAGRTAFSGALVARPNPRPDIAQMQYDQVYEADFSGLTTPGEYRLRMAGLGVSFPFLIDEGAPAAVARTYAQGLYHQRCGGKLGLPFTRFKDCDCHSAMAQIPTMAAEFQSVNDRLWKDIHEHDLNPRQTAPQLDAVDKSLYPFVRQGLVDVSLGHHDAGDYSKYTANVALMLSQLVSAADDLTGVGDLDNLGIPESGDGVSDLLQEAKWEADFLSKMQDDDGGFYFLVYPKHGRYESGRADQGDSQIVYPKTTAATAGAVGALAQIASSPRFKKRYPKTAALYLERAKRGWDFLERAIAKYGKDGSYQKITHYGDFAMHDDELAWAAADMFAATGDPYYYGKLKAWFDPSDYSTARDGWRYMFAAHGPATLSCAFAVRSGRLKASQVDPAYVKKCEDRLLKTADESLERARRDTYAQSFYPYGVAAWFFSGEEGYYLALAYELKPQAQYIEALLGNMNFELGTNPANVAYLTGLGWKRQREIVHQYAIADRRVLPPSGIPVGSVHTGYQSPDQYPDISSIEYPMIPMYDRWGDIYNVQTEFVVTNQTGGLGAAAFLMARSALKTQAWRAQSAQIEGLPATTPIQAPLTLSLSAAGLDLSRARIVWETPGQEPYIGTTFTFAPGIAGDQWIEAEAQLPDGRRLVAVRNYSVTGQAKEIESYQTVPLATDPDVAGWYKLDGTAADARGNLPALALSGRAAFDSATFSWPSRPGGGALRFYGKTDRAVATLPNSALYSAGQTKAVSVEAMIYLRDYAGGKWIEGGLVSALSLAKADNARLSFGQQPWSEPYTFIRGGTALQLVREQFDPPLTRGAWHHLRIRVDAAGYTVRVDGSQIAAAASGELVNWNGGSSTLELGGFDGWIDEVVVKNAR